MQVTSRAGALRASVRCSRAAAPFRAATVVVRAEAERLRLNNLSPEPGSRRDEKRKGRGYAAGQGGTCGFGNRGQKARAGPGPRPGFEGGQTALYRRLPKLRGIAGGMSAGLPDFVVVNLDDLEKHFQAGENVTIDAVKERVLSVSGRDTKLPLKVLGSGTLTKAVNVHAGAFSESAKAAIEAAGGKTEEVAGPKKWTKKAHKALVAELAAAGKDYAAIKLTKRIENLKSKDMYTERTPKAKKAAPAKGKAAKAK